MGALYEIDSRTAELSTIVRSAVTRGPLLVPTSLVAWDKDLILLSAISDSLQMWDR